MVDTKNPVLVFTAQDRCDACGAQAYSLAQHEDQSAELLFCLHHREQHIDRLLSDGWEIIDDHAAIEELVNA